MKGGRGGLGGGGGGGCRVVTCVDCGVTLFYWNTGLVYCGPGGLSGDKCTPGG